MLSESGTGLGVGMMASPGEDSAKDLAQADLQTGSNVRLSSQDLRVFFREERKLINSMRAMLDREVAARVRAEEARALAEQARARAEEAMRARSCCIVM
jgi:hypothetical protein